MPKQTTSRFLTLGGLGTLVVAFGLMLFVLAARLFVSMIPGSGTGGFAFAISVRALKAAMLVFGAVVATALVLIVRGLKRRSLS